MQVFPIKAFSDNYIWLIEGNETRIVIDPGEAAGVLDYLAEQRLEQLAILLTHKHEDHIGGVEAIRAKYPTVTVYGPVETKDLNNQTVAEGDFFELAGQVFKVLKTAGHTTEHISYLTENLLFCGDALFSGGCGRVFTGDYMSQYQTLQTFKQLDERVKVYAGHEYTETNLRFAQGIEPANLKIAEALKEAENLQKRGVPTLPSTIGREKKINLFLQAENLETFICLRKARDDF